ncbi:MAG: hypothetical protein ACLVCW_03035 [Campylobacter sp.]
MGLGASRAIRRCREGQHRLREKRDLATRAPSRSIESLDAYSEAGVRILKFYLHAPCKRMIIAKRRGGILKFH